MGVRKVLISCHTTGIPYPFMSQCTPFALIFKESCTNGFKLNIQPLHVRYPASLSLTFKLHTMPLTMPLTMPSLYASHTQR